MYTRPIIGLLSFIILDSIFLKLSKNHWNNQIKAIQKTNLNVTISSAVLAYIVMYIAWYNFIYLPNRYTKKINLKIIFDAFLLGFVIYGVYEFTNKAIINNWTWLSVLIDTTWGSILYMLVTLAAFSFN